MTISLPVARQLKVAGLIWRADINDYFAIPERGMDDRLFVLADMQAQLDVFRGWPVVSFHGTSEWALDYILTSEVVWMPREDQLRNALLAALSDEHGAPISLQFDSSGAACSIPWMGEARHFSAPSASDAYGSALLFVLENQRST